MVVKQERDYREQIIVALDVASKEKALLLVDSFEQQVSFVKVGMELYYGEGPKIIEELKKRDLKIFIDLKLHDIPNTVGKAAAQLTKLGVEMFNLHVAGGLNMMIAARENMEKNLTTGQRLPHLIGVTQLTSTDQKILNEELGIPTTVAESVVHYAKLAKKAGLEGVVSSVHEIELIKEYCGKDFLTVTPGIRLGDGSADDQKRIATPERAIKLGSDYLVIGRSITAAKNPAATFNQILNKIVNN